MSDDLAYENGYREEPWTETLNGEIVLMAPRPAVNHTRISFNIAFAFKSYLRGKTCESFSDGVDVYLTEKDIVIPDAMIVCKRDIIKRNGVHGAPDLVVEVLSHATAKRDRGYKKDLYERSGIREYWIVDPDAKSIEVYLLKSGKFALNEVYHLPPDDDLSPEEKKTYKAEVPVSLYGDFSIPLSDIFEDML